MSESFPGKVSSDDHEASKTFSDNTQSSREKSELECKWHDKLQDKIKSIEKQIHDRKFKNLNEDELEASRVLNQRFEEGATKDNEDGENEKGQSKWEQIKNFYAEPTFFKMRELQILVEADIKGKYPSMSQEKIKKEVKKEVLNLSKNIVSQIKKEIKAKHNIQDDEAERKMHQMKVKESVDEHLRLVVQFKQYNWQDYYSFYHI